MSRSNEPVALGKVTGTHGIKGQLKIAPYSGETETIRALSSVMLKGDDNRIETFEVVQSAVSHNRVLLALKPFTSINEVQYLVGRELCARRDQFPPLAEGEYYWCDLIGLAVATETGLTLGRVVEIIATGSNDVYVVRGGDKEYLIPALEDVVSDIDLDAGTMTISPFEGLLDL